MDDERQELTIAVARWGPFASFSVWSDVSAKAQQHIDVIVDFAS